jgi:hypothetical protein
LEPVSELLRQEAHLPEQQQALQALQALRQNLRPASDYSLPS